MKRLLNRIATRFGYEIREVGEQMPIGLSPLSTEILSNVKPFTQTSYERLLALIDAVEYVEAHGIRGDIVECGVWRGGSMMAVAKKLCSKNYPPQS